MNNDQEYLQLLQEIANLYKVVSEQRIKIDALYALKDDDAKLIDSLFTELQETRKTDKRVITQFLTNLLCEVENGTEYN